MKRRDTLKLISLSVAGIAGIAATGTAKPSQERGSGLACGRNNPNSDCCPR